MNRAPDTNIALIFFQMGLLVLLLANPVLKGGAMRRGSLDKVFIQVAIIAAIIILLTICIR